jgi:cytochrome c553
MKSRLAIVLIIYSFFCFAATAIATDETTQIDPTLKLIHVLGCKGCHVISGEGGSLAPDLTKIGSRMSVKQIKEQLITEPAIRTNGFMPSYNSLSDDELERISEYLYNLP